jgi:hypothetical protein
VQSYAGLVELSKDVEGIKCRSKHSIQLRREQHITGFQTRQQLRVLRFGFLQDWDVGVLLPP